MNAGLPTLDDINAEHAGRLGLIDLTAKMRLAQMGWQLVSNHLRLDFTGDAVPCLRWRIGTKQPVGCVAETTLVGIAYVNVLLELPADTSYAHDLEDWQAVAERLAIHALDAIGRSPA